MSAALDILIPAAHAHEKWFVDETAAVAARPEWYLRPNAATIGLLVAGVLLLALGPRLHRRFLRSRWSAGSGRLAVRVRAFAPRVLAACLGMSLVWSAWSAVLIADDFPLPASLLGTVLRAAEFSAGVLLTTGLFTAEAGLLTIALSLALFGVGNRTGAFDYLYFPAAGWFVFTTVPDGHFGELMRGRRIERAWTRTARAYSALRILTGTAFIVLAIGKLLHPELHFGLMDRYPDFNPYTILGSIGIHPSREAYVFALFSGELLTGLAVLAGVFERLLGLVLIPLFSVSVLFLGAGELVGHLPILGIGLVMFAYGAVRGPDSA